MNATIVTAAPKRGAIATLFAKHVTDQKVLSIEEPESSDMNSPSIQTTKTHVALLIPKNMLWVIILGSVVGGPSLMNYLGNRAGLVTRDELTSAIQTAVETAVEAAIRPIDERVARIERASKATNATKEASNAQ